MLSRRGFSIGSLALAGCGGGAPTPSTETPSIVNPPVPSQPPLSKQEAWRPRFHYSPARNWMNDPNGLVHVDGQYHLYYQYNPVDAQWGNISWGHAVSTDMVSWEELPVAIPATERVMAFSGCVVVDQHNTGGFAPAGSSSPALIAFFTGFDPSTKIQSQHLAFSLDGGRSYVPYAGNPVIDIGSTEFRDPKVLWHEPTRRWVMLVVAALRQEVWFYTSSDLRNWSKVSTFGPAGSAANNIWEVPELFELPVVGASGLKRWVLIVSVNLGSIWGGSGVQYFVGDFDGTSFRADPSDTVDAVTPPPGELVVDFEGDRFPVGWQLSGSAFGPGPANGPLPGQQHVGGFLGRGFASSFHGGDGSTGTLTSPVFLITKPFLCFQIAGGRSHATRVELVVGGRVLQQTSGDDTEILKWVFWDVASLNGLGAQLRIVDEGTGAWGHISVDHVVMTDRPISQPSNAEITLWADHGRDFYAPITFANMPGGRVVWLGWMSNWDYARVLPTQPWRGQQSLPRELSLAATPRGIRLAQTVVAEAKALVNPLPLQQLADVTASQVAAVLASSRAAGRQLRLTLRLSRAAVAATVGVELFKTAAGSTKVGFDPATDSYFVDRRTASPEFPGQSERHVAPRVLNTDELSLEVWVDGSTLELFADEGLVVISDLIYPDPSAVGLGFFHGAEDPKIGLLELCTVRSTMYGSGA
ncbi:MAG: glycoside hydrolase family 32 protein [Inhella sp.]|jgi:sucrose-6-phosphate hydrolase SacC (GH32 family)|nr:glycoside hydrolase family 32 protein [Inhella sp.]